MALLFRCWSLIFRHLNGFSTGVCYNFIMIKNTMLKTALLVATFGAMVSWIPASIAAPITTAALGHNSPTEYIDAPFMPYANPKAPTGGTLFETQQLIHARRWQPADPGDAVTQREYATVFRDAQAKIIVPDAVRQAREEGAGGHAGLCRLAKKTIRLIGASARVWGMAAITGDRPIALVQACCRRVFPAHRRRKP